MTGDQHLGYSGLNRFDNVDATGEAAKYLEFLDRVEAIPETVLDDTDPMTGCRYVPANQSPKLVAAPALPRASWKSWSIGKAMSTASISASSS